MRLLNKKCHSCCTFYMDDYQSWYHHHSHAIMCTWPQHLQTNNISSAKGWGLSFKNLYLVYQLLRIINGWLLAISACMWTCLIWIVFLWWRGVFWLGWRGFMWYYDIVKWFSIIKTHFSICFLFFSLQWNSPTSNIPNFCYLFIYLFFNIYIYIYIK